MSLYKKRILKSEEVRVVPGATIRREVVEEVSTSVSGAPDKGVDARPPTEEAYLRGLTEGKALGRKEVERELGRTLNLLKQTMNEVARLRSEIIKNGEKEIVALAMAIAEKIVRQELETNREAIKAIFLSAIEAIGEKEKLLVRCSPGDLPVLESYVRDLQASQGGLGEVEFIADTNLSPGGVKIETPFCEVDASLESQLAVIRKILFS
ncbi:MAG: FliH/SctL family protein [Syntrophales bacterium]|nr:FliH/SctL family protein [Syntrophales bacterium]